MDRIVRSKKNHNIYRIFDDRIEVTTKTKTIDISLPDDEGIGHCALGYAAGPANEAAPRKDDYVYFAD